MAGDGIEPPTQGFSTQAAALSHAKTMGYMTRVCGVLQSVLHEIKAYHAHTRPSGVARRDNCLWQRQPQAHNH